MVANPEVTVQDRAEVHELVARVASPEEKAALWPLATAVWPDVRRLPGGDPHDVGGHARPRPPLSLTLTESETGTGPSQLAIWRRMVAESK